MDIISDIVKDLVKSHYRYISDCEINSTEIEREISVIKLETQELLAYRELAQKYFQYNLQERERLFKSSSAVLEKSIENGDAELAQIAIKAIEIIHNKSPFSF